MGAIRRTINLIIALVLFAMGCGGLAYFYFIAATRNAGTFATSSVLLLVTAYMFGAGLLWAIAQTIAWCIIFFFASAAASSAYLTASEISPLKRERSPMPASMRSARPLAAALRLSYSAG